MILKRRLPSKQSSARTSFGVERLSDHTSLSPCLFGGLEWSCSPTSSGYQIRSTSRNDLPTFSRSERTVPVRMSTGLRTPWLDQERVVAKGRLIRRQPITRPYGVIIAYPRSQLGRSTCRARGISESVALRVLCSNCALSPAPQRACRSGRDSQWFSCGGGTPHTRDDSSSP